MSDPADRIDQWQRDNDPEPVRDWAGQVLWQGESVPTINPVADVVSRAVTGDLCRHDTDALCGLLLARGVSEAECRRIAHYVTADRDTLVIARHPELHPYYKPIRGATWGLYAA